MPVVGVLRGFVPVTGTLIVGGLRGRSVLKRTDFNGRTMGSRKQFHLRHQLPWHKQAEHECQQELSYPTPHLFSAPLIWLFTVHLRSPCRLCLDMDQFASACVENTVATPVSSNTST